MHKTQFINYYVFALQITILHVLSNVYRKDTY